MEDIKRQDRKLFIRELASPFRIFLVLLTGMFALLFSKVQAMSFSSFPAQVLLYWMFILAVYAGSSYNASIKKRFHNKRFQSLWTGCEDRLIRFREVLRRLSTDQIAHLSEMPKTIDRVGDSLYCALRRADLISHEVSTTEAEIYGGPPVWQNNSRDPQSKELYQIADKNIAEYRQGLQGVMAGVQRTEAQSAVYMTTLDTLRMKMLGYRLVGKSPEVSSQDFLEALNEAKLQLQAIDTALEELDLSAYPQMIAADRPPIQPPAVNPARVSPPPIPEELRHRLNRD